MSRGIELPIVDARELFDELRAALRPGETVACADGVERHLPTYFYEVDSWDTARQTRLTPNFTLHELMTVDVREHPAVRAWPRHVPCAVASLAAQLEVVRQRAGTLVWIAANGGYRSPSHELTTPGSPHGWGTAADVYRVGEGLMTSEERIADFAELVRDAAPGLWIHHGFDHLHVDIGFPEGIPRGVPGGDHG